MADDFTSLLDKPMSEVKAPVPMPVGSYIWAVQSHKFDKSTKKQTPYVEFTVAPVQPMPDVDQAELQDSLNGKALSEKTKTLTFYITEDSLFRLKEFFEHLGLDEGRSLRENVEEAAGRQFIGNVQHSAAENGNTYANIIQTAKVEG